jgi:hypothetical protein
MKIVRQTPNELVVRDSTLWLSAIFAAAALFLLYFAIFQAQRRALVAMAVMLMIALVWARRSTFTFSVPTQRVDWNRLRWLRTTTGTIPFSDLQGVDLQTTTSDKGITIYRLALATPQGPVPMSDEYSSGHQHIEKVRTAIQQFIQPPASAAFSEIPPAPANPDAVRTATLNDSVRALLRQGRKVDAILLVQRSEHLDLTEATFRVSHIENEIRSQKVGP